jgi:hypothetical protein
VGLAYFQHKDAVDAIEETTRLAIATDKSATEMKQLAETTRQSLVLTQRPWLYIKGDYIDPAMPSKLDANNLGSSFATEIQNYGKLLMVTDIMGHTPGINYHDIPCVRVIGPPLGEKEKTWSLPAKKDETLLWNVDVSNIKSFLASKYSYTVLAGCMQYQWPFGNELFHRWFFVHVDIINQKTGDLIYQFSQKPSSDGDYGFRITTGAVAYIQVD